MTPHARQRLTALNALLTLSAGDASLDEKLAKALDLVLQVTWVQTKQKGAIFLVEGSSTISMRAWQGFSDEMRERCASISVGVGVCGRVAEQKKELFARNPGNESCGCFRNLPCYARYGMPIMAGSRVLGVIVQYVENESVADESGMDFLRAVASTLAGIIQRREAEDRIRDLLQKNQALARRLMVVQEEEYRRFARELHDEMGQSITAIKADAVLIATHCRDGRAEDVGRWATSIISVTDHIYEVIYAVIRRLRPCTLDELGLVAAVEDLLTNWQKRYPWLQFQFKPQGDLDSFGENINIAVYRVIQECLANACRHAAASRVSVHLESADEGSRQSGDNPERRRVLVIVRDNGRGMDVALALRKAERFGLLGMRERIEGLGGDMRIESGIDRGTQVIISIPMERTP